MLSRECEAVYVPSEVRVPAGEIALAVRAWPCPSPKGWPPVVLLPGTGATATDWDVVARQLSNEREVFAVDLRGHGSSDWPGTYSIQLLADDVTAALPVLADGPADLVGHSLGGLVACKVAAAHPELVRRLVLEDVGLPRPRIPAPPERPDGELSFDWAVVEQVRPEIDAPDPSWPSIFSHVRAPTLVIAGGPASFVPQEQIADLVHLLPDGRLVTIDTGHLVHATKPEEFTQQLTTFVDAARPA